MRRVALVLLVALLWPCPSQAATAFVQSVSTKWFGGTGSPVTITFPGVSTAGNLIAVYCGWGAGGVAVTTIGDGTNTYTDPGDTKINGTTGRSTTRYAKNISGGTFTVSVSWGADEGFGFCTAHEISGADTTAPLDQHAIVLDTGGASGTDAVAGSAVTTTTAGQYIFGASFDEGGGATFVAGTGYALRESQAGPGASEDIQSLGSAGSTTITFTQTGDNFGTYHVATMTFKAAGGGGAPACRPTLGLLGVSQCGE